MADDGGTGGTLATVGEGDVDFRWEDGEGVARVDFEAGPALAVLLAHGVVFPNAPHWRDDLPEVDRLTAVLIVDCSDVFAWGAADGEVLTMPEVERLYRIWRRDPTWGAAAWAVMARGAAPQPPVAGRMAAAGTWDPARLACGDAAAARAYVDGVVGGRP